MKTKAEKLEAYARMVAGARRGGLAKSRAKAAAVRANGAKSKGRPRKVEEAKP
jgi:hypothetical protein